MSVSCPLCRSTESRVSHTWHRFEFRHDVRQIITLRRRICDRCGLPFRSEEVAIPERIPSFDTCSIAVHRQ